MAEDKLENPDLPAGAIVATPAEDDALAEGQVRRNDGVVLNPAAKNPWYVLATVAGEHSGHSVLEIDDDLHARNRRIWNGWMCRNMAEAERAMLTKTLALQPTELAPLTEEERALLDARFVVAFPDLASADRLPDPCARIDIRKTHFPNPFVVEGYAFLRTTNFDAAHFAKGATFNAAHFAADTKFLAAHFEITGNFYSAFFADRAIFRKAYIAGHAAFPLARFATLADFETAHFAEDAIFERAHFGGHADFRTAHFAKPASFANAHFVWSTDFKAAHFEKTTQFSNAHFAKVAEFKDVFFTLSADFEAAHFAGAADFASATFEGRATFSDGTFGAKTVFKDARFLRDVPEFYQRELHQNTSFSTTESHWPTITPGIAEEGKRAYTRLRQLMLQLEKPDDAHFFFRQEMRCKEFEEDHWWNRVPITLFRWLSDYGYSVARPAAGLALAWLVPGFAYLFHFAAGIIAGTAPVSILGPFGLSFANLFAFLGLHRVYFVDVLTELPGGLQALAGAQTVAGVVLLFFLGLGLRNRFRLH